ncbi:MAG: heme NO-binding domain-containing protein, partial [Myxococcota bacterium]
ELRPPTFRYEKVAPDRHKLHYHSHRAGLAPMVIGLVKGLAKRFGHASLQIVHATTRGDDSDHDIFLITDATQEAEPYLSKTDAGE